MSFSAYVLLSLSFYSFCAICRDLYGLEGFFSLPFEADFKMVSLVCVFVPSISVRLKTNPSGVNRWVPSVTKQIPSSTPDGSLALLLMEF